MCVLWGIVSHSAGVDREDNRGCREEPHWSAVHAECKSTNFILKDVFKAMINHPWRKAIHQEGWKGFHHCSGISGL